DETDAVITFSGTLSAVTVASTTFTVTDDDGAPGSIELSVSPTAVTEGDGATQVTVTATILGSTRFGTAKTVTVSVAGSGTPGVVGFSPVSSFSLTINANQASGTAMFTLTPTNNSTYQSPETITVSGVLSGVTVSSATLDLTDDDLPPPVVSFTQSAESALEATSPRLVTVILDRVVTSPVTVAYTTSGTATSGSDYTAPSGSVTVAASAQTATISLAVADDDDHEDAETIILTLSSGSGYTVGTQSVHTATIIDNEAAPVGGTLEEGASLIPSGLSYGDRFRLLFVTSTKRNAASADIADYNAFVQTRAAAGHAEIVAFASGFRAVASTAAVDATDNSDTNTTVDGVGVPIYWIGGDKAADDYADFYDGDWDSRAAVDESGSTVDVDNSGDLLNGNGIWTGSNSSGTGQGGLELGTATPRIADLGTTSSMSTPLSLLTGPQSERPKQNARYLYALSPLLEYVGPELTVASASSGVTEGANITFTISGVPAVPGTISVGYTVTQTGDFVCDADQGDQTVSFTGSSVTVMVCTENDQTSESSGSATVTLNKHTTYRVSSTQNSVTVPVWDNDGGVTLPVVSVTGGSAVTEGTAASFTVSVSPAPTGTDTVTVHYTVTQTGSYVASGDRGAKQVTIGSSGTATVSVPTQADSNDEDNGSVTVTIDADSAYTISNTAGDATVTVNDDDDPATQPQLTITRDTSPIVEGQNASFTITASPAPTSTITIRYNVSQSGDYVISGNRGIKMVDLTGGSTSVTFTVATEDDSADEDNGSVTVTIFSGTGYTRGSPNSATITVNDNDGSLPVASVTAGTSPVTEGTAASFTVSVSPAPTGSDTVTVHYTVTQTGSYVASGDRGAKQVTIGSSGTATVSVPTQADSNDEDNGSVTVTIDADSAYTISNTAGDATVTVNDDDDPATQPRLSVTRSAAAVTEGSPAAFTISASPAATSSITVRYRVSQSGSFLTGGTGNRTVRLSGASAAISLATVDDSADESNGSVTVTILTNSGYTVGSPQSATVTVRDNDTGGGGTPPPTTTPPRPSVPPPPVVDVGDEVLGPVWGLWGDGVVLWAVGDDAVVVVQGAGSDHEVVLDGANGSPRGLWSD
ncbi:MAG: hypothetical protein F4134_09485, partial [Acidimicrobiaceae bacterium]|nr:hypothetical protein [Acidimicrobiaceae bacterium]